MNNIISPVDTIKLVVLEEGSDLDALSSAFGVLLLYEDAYLLRPSYLSRRASEVFKRFTDLFRVLEKPPESFDLVLVDSHNYEDYLERYGSSIKDIYIYDHHPKAPIGFKGKVDRVGSCTTLLVEELIERGIRMDERSATLLALGIYEDTGMLTYEGTTPRDARAVEWLLSMGVNLKLLREFLGESLTKEQIDMLSKHLISLSTLFLNGKRISLLVLKMEEYSPELLSFIYDLKEVRDSSAFFVIVEAGGKTYLFGRALRGKFDVSEVLEKLGGGGHEFASAAKFEDVHGERLKTVLEAILKGENPPIKVGQVMSTPAFLLHQEMDAELALLELTQRNFAGAPVVDDAGRLVGVVYKKNLLKAQKHGLRGKVRDFMVEDFHSLKVEDFIWRAEEILSKYGEKLIPVLTDSTVCGVVTRLDLLHAYRKHALTLKAHEKPLSLPENLRPLLQDVGRIANSLGYRAYLVGGVVRDLLMKKRLWDLDFVIEGDAIRVAQDLAKEYGVSLHPFPEFGTAHLKIGNFKIEFATTRRETYPHPGSYPRVEWATLKEDLLRRDFTINAMAVSVNPEDFGTLIDYFGGLRDLKDRIIRVLHPMSFAEDPVRILRALRFAGRFNFKLSKSTEKLLRSAVSARMLEKAPKGRLLNELRLALREEKLLDILQLYRKYGVLQQIVPRFEWKPQTEELLERLKEVINWHKIEFPEEQLDYGWVFFLLLLSQVPLDDGLGLLRDMSAPAWARESYKLIKQELHKVRHVLSQADKSSEVYKALKGKPLPFLLLLMTQEREKTKLYLEKLRFIKVDVSMFKGLTGRELGEAVEREKLRLIDELYSSAK
jgi:tRNA nucleotidyltransferase (CCA-adding enzyme)